MGGKGANSQGLFALFNAMLAVYSTTTKKLYI